ncbi:MAG TPA: ABC transporter ATP-binding protein [Pilimelia sp.]|nr:ABC transporter ATP-binding protein [Pilimelia sp.]
MSAPSEPAGGFRLQCGRAWAAIRLGFAAAPGTSAVVVVLAVLDGALAPAAAWALKVLLDALGGGDPDTGRVAVVVAVLCLLGLLSGCQQGLSSYATGVLGRAVRLAVVDRLFTRVNGHPGLALFENPEFRDRLRLAEQAGDHAPAQVTTAALQLLRTVVQVGGFIAVLLAVWPPIIPLALASAVPAAVLHVRLGRERAGLAASLSGNVRRQFFYKTLLTDPRAAKEVRLFGIGPFLHGRLLRDFRTANAAENRLAGRSLRVEIGLEIVGAGVAAAGTAAAVWQVVGGHISLGDLTAFIAAVAGVRSAAVASTEAWAEGYEAVLLFGAFHEIVTEPVVARPYRHPALPPLRDGIELRDVWFRYGPDAPWVLRGASVTIRRGEAVGLVGLNGAGKSTLVKLLCRMYEPERGAILWDGVDIAEVDPSALRARVAAVFQDYVEYDLTAAENIAVGHLPALDDPAAIRAAATTAGVHDQLARLPHGYDTLLSRLFVAESGDDDGVAMLSGGQWQRVALARGFLRTDADLLILDEPSSGLDAEAEHALHQRLVRLRTGRTSLLISHRLSAMREADRVVVLADGRVIEEGPHGQLLAAGGDYARLFSLQAAGYQDGGPAVAGLAAAAVPGARPGTEERC